MINCERAMMNGDLFGDYFGSLFALDMDILKQEGYMPLLDHFHPPLYPRHHWESFHSNWATRLADALTARLPPEFQVEEHSHLGINLEIDIATFAEDGELAETPRNGPPTQKFWKCGPRRQRIIPCLPFSRIPSRSASFQP